MHVVVVAVDVESCKIAALSIAERGIAIAQISRNAVGEGIGAAQAYVPGKIGVHVGAEFGGISKGCEYLAREGKLTWSQRGRMSRPGWSCLFRFF